MTETRSTIDEKSLGRPLRRLNAYLTTLVLVALMPVLLIACVVVYKTSQGFRDASTNRLIETTVPLARAVEAELDGSKRLIEKFADDLGEPQSDISHVAATNWLVGALDAQLVRETVAGTADKLPATGETPAGLPFDAIRASRASGRAAVSNLYPHRADGSPRFAIVAAGANDEYAALVVKPENIIRLLQSGSSQGGRLLVAVTDGAGRIVARSRGGVEMIGRPVPDWAKLKSMNSPEGVFEAETKEGGKVIFSFLELKDLPGWVVVVGESLENFNNRWQRPIGEIVLACLAACLLALLVAVWVSHRILDPVRALAVHADNVANGVDGEQTEAQFVVAEFESLRKSLAQSEQTLRARLDIANTFASQVANSERRYKTLAEAGAMVFWTCAEDGALASATGFEDLTGAAPGEAAGAGWRAFVHPDDLKSMNREWHAVARATRFVDIEFRVRAVSGAWRWVRARASLIESGDQSPPEWVGVLEDVDTRRRAQARVAHMALHDPLTGLANRAHLRERLVWALDEDQSRCSVLCLDLDRFKLVNDTLGHSLGDELLIEVSRRIVACIDPDDFVARLGGDEFAIIAHKSPAEAVALAARLVRRLAETYLVGNVSVVIGASVGIALHEDETPELLLQRADIALYEAKTAGKGVWRMFEPGMDEKLLQRSRIERELRAAIQQNQLEAFYQPLVNPVTRRVVGFEALLRWNHPTRGLLSPSEFIPVAEETGLIIPIGAKVLEQACAQATLWPEDIKVSVNISPVQLGGDHLVNAVLHALKSSGLAPRRLELEITENALISNIESAMSALLRLKALGCGVVMDDFGSGGSSLSYLKSFPFTRVKIDKSFTLNLDEGAENAAIVRAVAGICASLGITSTAEGVETEEQLAFVRDQNCAEVQGFLFGRPSPASQLPGVIARLNGQPIEPKLADTERARRTA